MTERTVIATIEVTKIHKDIADDAILEKEEVIENIKEEVKKALDADDVVVTNMQEFVRKVAVDEIQKEYNNGWIPCSERLPNEEEMKRACCNGSGDSEFIVMIEGAIKPTTLYRTQEGFWTDGKWEIYKVIAWQPLPEPYKEEGTE